MSSSLLRLKAWAHWVKLDKEADEDQLMMAGDIENALDVIESAKEVVEKYLSMNHYEPSIEIVDLKLKILDLKLKIKELENNAD